MGLFPFGAKPFWMVSAERLTTAPAATSNTRELLLPETAMPLDSADASMVMLFESVIWPPVSVTVWPDRPAAKLTVSPGLALAMRVRSVPGPLSAVLVTVNMAARDDGARARVARIKLACSRHFVAFIIRKNITWLPGFYGLQKHFARPVPGKMKVSWSECARPRAQQHSTNPEVGEFERTRVCGSRCDRGRSRSSYGSSVMANKHGPWRATADS